MTPRLQDIDVAWRCRTAICAHRFPRPQSPQTKPSAISLQRSAKIKDETRIHSHGDTKTQRKTVSRQPKAKNLSPRPPLLKERGRVAIWAWRCQSTICTPQRGRPAGRPCSCNDGAGPLPPAQDPHPKIGETGEIACPMQLHFCLWHKGRVNRARTSSTVSPLPSSRR